MQINCDIHVLLIWSNLFLSNRFDSEKAGDREVQRTMLELLNQLDGFSSSSQIKVPKTRFSIRISALRSNEAK